MIGRLLRPAVRHKLAVLGKAPLRKPTQAAMRLGFRGYVLPRLGATALFRDNSCRSRSRTHAGDDLTRLGFRGLGFTGLGFIGFLGFRGFIGFIGLIGLIGFIGFRVSSSATMLCESGRRRCTCLKL